MNFSNWQQLSINYHYLIKTLKTILSISIKKIGVKDHILRLGMKEDNMLYKRKFNSCNMTSNIA